MATPKTDMNNISKREGSIPSSNRYDLNVSIKSMTEDQRLKTAEEYKTSQHDQKIVSRRNIPAFKPLM